MDTAICSSVYYVRNLKEAKKEIENNYRTNDYNIDLLSKLDNFYLFSNIKQSLIKVSIHESNIINGRHEELLQVDVWVLGGN